MPHHHIPRSNPKRNPLLILLLALLLIAGLLFSYLHSPKPPEKPLIPPFTTQLSKVAPALQYRIVSFHRGRADKNLILLASQLGFNGVQFQLEGSNQLAIQDFADRDKTEHLVDYCHSLHMSVTLWVHELSDLPAPWMPTYLGDNIASNNRIFRYLDSRYEWILGTAVPNIDGLVLTVVETQVRATNSPLLLRITDTIQKKCDKYHKSLTVRTFVWTPEEFSSVMNAVNQLPATTPIMSKIVPQDWQLRGPFADEIGAVAPHPQIIEFDVEGEYFLHNAVANCMPDLLKKQFDYLVSKHAAGICVRVDRFDDQVLFQPNEVNLWTLGLLASGASNNTDDIWHQYLAYRYPTSNTATLNQLIKTLKPTSDVVAELLSIGPFTHGDTRNPAPLPDQDLFSQNWQPWRRDKSLEPLHTQAEAGDENFIQQVTQQKETAAKSADQSLADLEVARPGLSDLDYQILHTKLLTNKTQLAIRTPMQLISLEFRNLLHTTEESHFKSEIETIRTQLADIKKIAYSLQTPPAKTTYLNQTWNLGVPEAIDPQYLLYWCWSTELLIDNKRPILPPPQQSNQILPPYAPSLPPIP